MAQRILYGTISLLVLVTLFMLDVLIGRHFSQREGPVSELLARGSLIPLIFLAAILCGVFELTSLMRRKNARPHAALAYVMVGLVFLSPWLSASGLLGTGIVEREGLYWPLVFLMASVVGGCFLSVARREPASSISDLAATLLIIFYLGFLPSFALQIRSSLDAPAEPGAWLLLITLLITKCSDIGAYFLGSALGRTKLIPTVSPGKSVEGTIGGLLASALVAVVLVKCGTWVPVVNPNPGWAVIGDITRSFAQSRSGEGFSPLGRAVVFGVAMSAAGQLGDLIESCFKRDAGVKDSGSLLPRFGGILDLIDSPLMALPVAWFLLTEVWELL